jgi:hypothetical protein
MMMVAHEKAGQIAGPITVAILFRIKSMINTDDELLYNIGEYHTALLYKITQITDIN